ncbi:hypothetical protein TGARI_207360 [Toxoplasma gondii ARI]|uniref:Uncharacterized protein n=1 Tax=Toxoplasma gondii ARI TaxID=1074872 RepID=A0A139XRP8_TOXGO|nr:hypothetical protein TGARI_207360 [Toxoplasma gondii ARI]
MDSRSDVAACPLEQATNGWWLQKPSKLLLTTLPSTIHIVLSCNMVALLVTSRQIAQPPGLFFNHRLPKIVKGHSSAQKVVRRLPKIAGLLFWTERMHRKTTERISTKQHQNHNTRLLSHEPAVEKI